MDIPVSPVKIIMNICPLCKSDRINIHILKDEEGIRERLKVCLACNHQWKSIEKDDWVIARERMVPSPDVRVLDQEWGKFHVSFAKADPVSAKQYSGRLNKAFNSLLKFRQFADIKNAASQVKSK